MRKGLGSTMDILFLGLIVSISLLLVIGSVQTNEMDKVPFADERAQNTLLIIQKVPVEELGSISYTPNLSEGRTTTRELERKPLSRVIKEEVLLNPTWVHENKVIRPKTNSGLTKALENTIRSSLDVLVGKRFDYRFKIGMGPEKVSENTSIFYRDNLSEISPSSEEICSETVKLFLFLPDNLVRPRSGWEMIFDKGFATSQKLDRHDFYSNHSSENNFDNEVVPIFLTLELWSK